MTNDPWAEMPRGDGSFIRWTDPGQKVVGTIVEMGVGTDINGNPCPQLTINTPDGDVIVTCSQAQLRSKIIEIHKTSTIKIGDKIAIIYTQNENRAGGKTLKCFDVSHKAENTPETPTTQNKPSAADLF
jgi:hypothetical protein